MLKEAFIIKKTSVLLALIVVLIVSALLVGCSGTDITRAEASVIASDFFDRFYEGDFEAARRMFIRLRGRQAHNNPTAQDIEDVHNVSVAFAGSYESHEITNIRSMSDFFEVTVTAKHTYANVVYTIRVDHRGNVSHLSRDFEFSTNPYIDFEQVAVNFMEKMFIDKDFAGVAAAFEWVQERFDFGFVIDAQTFYIAHSNTTRAIGEFISFTLEETSGQELSALHFRVIAQHSDGIVNHVIAIHRGSGQIMTFGNMEYSINPYIDFEQVVVDFMEKKFIDKDFAGVAATFQWVQERFDFDIVMDEQFFYNAHSNIIETAGEFISFTIEETTGLDLSALHFRVIAQHSDGIVNHVISIHRGSGQIMNFSNTIE